ncbi:hypothetical protein [Arthrobacter sp. UYEF13]|uniref:hypothetical protein n=1 Tax=unclassified Pseudarthrobacter TaxID=2647000 RepID=UPI00339208EA
MDRYVAMTRANRPGRPRHGGRADVVSVPLSAGVLAFAWVVPSPAAGAVLMGRLASSQ